GIFGRRADLKQGHDRFFFHGDILILDRADQSRNRSLVGGADLAQGDHRLLASTGVRLFQFRQPMIDWLAVGPRRLFFAPAAGQKRDEDNQQQDVVSQQ